MFIFRNRTNIFGRGKKGLKKKKIMSTSLFEDNYERKLRKKESNEIFSLGHSQFRMKSESIHPSICSSVCLSIQPHFLYIAQRLCGIIQVVMKRCSHPKTLNAVHLKSDIKQWDTE